MAKEVNSHVQTHAATSEDMIEEMDFAAMLEESFRDNEQSTVVNGVIVDIQGDVTLVDVGKKSEGRLYTSEITDSHGNLKFNVGDSICVLVTGFRNEKPSVSYKKALKKEKTKLFIDKNKDFKEDLVFDIKIINKNKGGFIAENSDGVEFFLPKSQVVAKDLQNLIGKHMKVCLLKIDSDNQSIIVSRKKLLDEERKKRRDIVQELLEKEDSIEGTIKKITSYGMFVDVGGVDGLVHYSEISYKGPVNPNTLYKEGDKVLVKAIGYDKDKRHLSLSIKSAMPDPWEEIRGALGIKDVIQVTVSNIEPYGAFVDLGNDIEGFLHISEISWNKNIKHPKEYIQEGQEIDVEVIEISVDERRLRVSLRNTLPKPFEEFTKKHSVGDVLKGVITTITAFGAFVKINGIEGLLHNEDASWDRTKKCKDMFKEGDELEVKIAKIDTQTEKVSLSLKEIQESPVSKYIQNHSIGTIVSGKIRDIKDFGLFVELDKNVDGLIRKEDIGQQNVENLSIGDEVESVIVFIDEKKGRIRLSLKQLSKMKEREALDQINKDDKMTLGDILKDQLH